MLSYGTVHVHWLTTTDAAGKPLPSFPQGYLVSVVLLALFVGINFFGVRWLARTNSAATWWKVLVPLLAVVVFFGHAFHGPNFTASGGFMPYGIHGVFAATAAGAVIFALLGFEQAIQFGGKSANPQRDLPRAVIYSMIIGAVVYILLQVVFIAAVPGHSPPRSCSGLAFKADAGPFAEIATLAGLGWLATVLYVDALTSRGGTGLIWTPWQTVWKLGICILLGYLLIGLNFVFKLNPRAPKLDWRSAQWLPVYLIGVEVIPYFRSFGGRGDLKLGPDFLGHPGLQHDHLLLGTSGRAAARADRRLHPVRRHRGRPVNHPAHGTLIQHVDYRQAPLPD